jgi:hypothetical protein
MYASFLRISRALHLVVFEQPENQLERCCRSTGTESICCG